MNTFQLKEALKILQLDGNVLPFDQFQEQMITSSKPQAFILNTDDSFSDGEHWCCFYNLPTHIEFFDSYGQPHNVYFPHMTFEKPVIHNGKWIQDWSSQVCGHHCIFYLYLRLKKVNTLERAVNDFYDPNLPKFNDKAVHSFVRSHFCSAFKHKHGGQCCIPCIDVVQRRHL